MAGRKHHFLQRLHLEGFVQGAKPTHTWVYRSNGKIFEAAIKDYGAERDFYGDPQDKTLDDEITELESERCNGIINSFRTNPDGPRNSEDASFYTILAFFRSKNIRQTFQASTLPLVERTALAMSKPEFMVRMLTKGVRDDPSSLYRKFGSASRAGKILKSPTRLTRMMRDFVREKSTELEAEMKRFKKTAANLVAAEHNRTLLSNLRSTEGSRANLFKTLHWQCITVSQPLILGDSMIYTELEDGMFRPVSEPTDHFVRVWMPVTSNRILVGNTHRNFPEIHVNKLNQGAAACSFDSFCSRENQLGMKQLIPLIRTRTFNLSEKQELEVIEAALSKLV